jgi:hypothetical protein
MKPRPTQFGARENTASSRQHAPRLAVSPSSSQPATAVELLQGTGDQLLTVDEVAARLSVSRNWVYNHADAIGGYRLGKYLRFSWPRVLERLGR